MNKDEVWARRPFTYNGRDLDRGEIFELQKMRNDEKLVRLGYVNEARKTGPRHDCRGCERTFADEILRDGHFRRRHRSQQEMNPHEEDRAIAREEKKLGEVAPLYLDKTTASRT